MSFETIDTGYLEFSGTSIAIVRKGQNTFTATVALHDEDRDVASSFAGCQFAEIKAIIKGLKYDLAERRKELRTLEILYKDIINLRDFAALKHSQPVRFIRKQIKIKTAAVLAAKQAVEDLQADYPIMVDERLTLAREFPGILQRGLELQEARKAALGDSN